MLLEHGVQHQRAGSTIAAVADADDHKAHACLFDLVPVDVLLILGNIHTECLAIFQHTIRIEGIEFIVDALDAGHRLVGGLAVVVGLAAGGAPAGIDWLRIALAQPAEQEIEQPAEKSVLIAQVDALGLGGIHGTGIQRGTDLLRGQYDAVFRGVLIRAVFFGFCGLYGRCLRVLSGQLRRLRLQGGHIRLLHRPGRRCRFLRLCSQCQRCAHRKGKCRRQNRRCTADLELVPEHFFHAVLQTF